MNLAIIPARGGSKRIPRKNIKPFCGRPMIAHSILTAVDSGLFDRIIVSTDDQKIADIAVKRLDPLIVANPSLASKPGISIPAFFIASSPGISSPL